MNEDLLELKMKADEGDAEAQFNYAWSCLWECNEPPYDMELVATVISYFQAAAEQGHCDAMLDLGAVYAEGLSGTPADFEKAVQWYRKAADCNYPKAFRCMGYALGFHLFRDSYVNYEEAYRWFLKGALLGEENCLYELGDLYMFGHYVEQDKPFAFALYQKSYETIDGNLDNDSYGDVCLRLGKSLFAGEGVQKDLLKAEEYLEEAESAYEYRVDENAPTDWIDSASSGLDEARCLLKEIRKRGE